MWFQDQLAPPELDFKTLSLQALGYSELFASFQREDDTGPFLSSNQREISLMCPTQPQSYL
jgi:hypothetical protein